MSAVDHVLLAVPDLGAAAAALERDHGLAALPGGRHPGWGTANLIVPLGGPYLELIAVVDPDEGAGIPLAEAVAAVAGRGGGLLAWCVAPDDIAAAAARLGVPAVPGARVRDDGRRLSWRLAGLERALACPPLPFLIAWDDPAQHPGAQAAPHRHAPRGVVEVRVSAPDPRACRRRLAGVGVPVEVSAGAPALAAVRIATDAGDIVLGA